MAKKLDFMTYNECPNCGKENPVRDYRDQGFCNNTCRTNYMGKKRYVKEKRYE